MPSSRTPAQQQVAALLRTAREALGLTMAFLSRFDEDTQYLEVVESGIPLVARDGVTQVRATSFCQVILDGDLPPVIPNVRDFPNAMALPAARFPRLRSYLSVPVMLSDGTLYGTFCAAGLRADRQLQERDRAMMEVLAHAASLIIEPGFVEEREQAQIAERLGPLLEAGGPEVHFQAIVSLTTSERVGAEALSRFPAAWDRAPDLCFADAHRIGRGIDLELLAVARGLESLADVDGYIGVNLSPAALQRADTARLLREFPLDRVLLELSEHDPVGDYDELAAVLGPLRADGLRLAIDDVGAGFSSLRHIVIMRPDVIKLDRALVAGVEQDPVLQTLAASLVALAGSLGASTVAEGIECAGDAAVLADLGVDYGQGWHFGRPGPVDQLTGGS